MKNSFYSASSAAFCIDGPASCGKMRFSTSSAIFRILFHGSAVKDSSETGGLIAGLVASLVIGLSGGLFYDSSTASMLISGFCTVSSLSSGLQKVERNDGLAQLCAMHSGSLILRVNSGFQTWHHILPLSWLCDILSPSDRVPAFCLKIHLWFFVAHVWSLLSCCESFLIGQFLNRKIYEKLWFSRRSLSWNNRSCGWVQVTKVSCLPFSVSLLTLRTLLRFHRQIHVYMWK